MRRINLLFAVGGLLVGLGTATHLSTRAQDEKRAGGLDHAAASKPESRGSIQDALLKPFHFGFRKPLALAELATRLGRELGTPVVLDLAALERLEVKPEDTVTLELDGVRLKTGLKLLLDQVGLTYRVVPEDNLLVLTDKEGAEDPLERLAAEVKELHRDIHDVQDAVDELRDLLNPTGDGARVRKPTIIEELPENAEPKPDEKPQGPATKAAPRSDTNPKPPASSSPRPRTRL